MTADGGPSRVDDPRPRGTGGRVDRAMVRLLGSPAAALLDRSLVVLRYRSSDGRTVVLPVRTAGDGHRLVVPVGAPVTKRWWRHFRDPAPVEVWTGRGWWPGTAAVTRGATSSDVDRGARTGVDPDATLVTIELTTPPTRSPLRGRTLLGVWFVCVTIAEVLGFVAPAVTGALTADAAPAVTLPALLLAGAVEGAVLGLGQGVVLRAAVPGLPVRRWVAATTAGAVLAYGLGMLPPTAYGVAAAWPPVVLGVAGGLLGALLLGSIGTAQWLVLRRHVPGSASWVATTALGWAGGLAAFLAVCTPLWAPGRSLALTVAVGVLGGLVMAATMAVITGVGLVRLLGRASGHDGPEPSVP